MILTSSVFSHFIYPTEEEGMGKSNSIWQTDKIMDLSLCCLLLQSSCPCPMPTTYGSMQPIIL